MYLKQTMKTQILIIYHFIIINCNSLLIRLIRASMKLRSTVAYSLCVVSNNCVTKASVNVEMSPCFNSINVSDEILHSTILSSIPFEDTT